MPQTRKFADLSDGLSDLDGHSDHDFHQRKAAWELPRTPSPHSFYRAQLTEENLELHTQLHSPEEAQIMVGTSVPSTGTSSHDSETKLANFGVVLGSLEPLPVILRRYLNDVVDAPRASESPSAKNLHDVQPFAESSVSEMKGISLIAQYLMFPDCTNPGDERGERNVSFVFEAQFNRQYVKHRDGSSLTQPRPDLTNGYMSRKVARGLIPAPFDEDEEQILNENNIHSEALCPYITAEFKSARVALFIASLQAARNGVAVQNYLQALYERAGMQPSVVDTCHWSIVCNTQSAQLFLHWRGEGGKYHMRPFCSADLRASFKQLDKNPAMVTLRRYLRNILEYALNERLRRIKDVIAGIAAKRDEEDASPAQRQPAASRRSGAGQGRSVAFSVQESGYASVRPTQSPARRETTASPYKKRRTEPSRHDEEADELGYP